MKKLICILGLICVFGALGIVSSGASASGPEGIEYKVCEGPAPIHASDNSESLTLGHLGNGQIFYAVNNSANNFDYGIAYGNVNSYGFMNRHYEC
jgi:hypothetical protein